MGGGAEDWAHELTSSLLKRGYDVDIIENMASKTRKELKQYTKRIDKKNRGISEVLVELIEWLLQRRPFTLFNIWSSEVLWAASYIKSIYPKEAQIIASVLNDTNNVYQRLCEWDDVIDIYLCISSKIKNNLIKLYRINEKKVYYRSPFVEHVKNFEREFQTDNRIPLKIGFPCRLTRNQKRADLLPELIVKLEKKAVHYALNIVGSGEYEKDIIKFVNDSNLHSKISFFGKLSRKELLLFLNNQDIYLNLSDFEGTSLTMLEAMARGCVPVVTNVSGVDDFIENMINGMVSEIGDIENIADNILFLDNNRDKLEIYSKRCMEIISFKCKLENYIDYIEKIIN